jgi:hypothetical protein
MSALFDWLGDVIVGLWGALKKVFENWWALVIGILTSVYMFVEWLAGKVIEVFQSLATVISHGLGMSGDPCASGLASYMAIANTFFPVDETLRLLFALVSLWLVIGLYRMVKSWLPAGFAGGS